MTNTYEGVAVNRAPALRGKYRRYDWIVPPQQFAQELGVNYGNVTSWASTRGMPTSSVEAAREWLVKFRENKYKFSKGNRLKGSKSSWKHIAAAMCGISASTALQLAAYKHAPKHPTCFWLWFLARQKTRAEKSALVPKLAKERSNQRRRERYKNDPEYREQRRLKDLKRRSSLEFKVWRRRYWKERRERDPQFRMYGCLKARMHKLLNLQSAVKSGRTYELIGCSVPFLQTWIESQFKRGMTWANHGEVWHIDHIMPASKFNLTDPIEQRKAFHYTNLQPLWAFDNMSKNDKVLPHQAQLMLNVA
jgi:hypothetical protein